MLVVTIILRMSEIGRKKLFFRLFIVLVFLYAIFIIVRRQINESYLDKRHIYITVKVSKINFGKTSTVHYEFNFENKLYNQRQMYTLGELRKMNIGDIYLAKFNEEIKFSELMCGCRLSKSDESKVWDKYPGCKN